MTLLFLNSLGTWEVALILLVVLILFGSKGIPDIAKNLGKGMREIRTASTEIKRDIQSSAMEMKKDLGQQDITKELPDLNKILDDHPTKTPPIAQNKENVEQEDLDDKQSAS